MGNFVVSARKYRPNKFNEVVGQGHVSQTLKNALQNDHLAHAFLFCGPRGVGKTTCARILAKTINCTNKTADFEACGECNSCTSFEENASFNVIELDAASNNSVEHIRALNEQVRFQPQQGRYKVFIIDEVHMLSQSAFNAFLKTLEEPPPYAIFILATTEKHKIIPTILSRCQIFDFKRIQIKDIIKHLEGICETEKIVAEPEALHVIAQKADGALRDALSIFDRIVSFSGDKISYKDVIDNLNVLDYDYFFKIVDAFLTENLPDLLNTYDLIQKNGFEGDIVILGLAEHLRNLLVSKDEKTIALLELSENLKLKYLEQARLCSNGLLLTALHIANDCDVNYPRARNKRLHVEIALCKMAYAQRQSATSFSDVKNGAHQAAPNLEKKTPDLSPIPPIPNKEISSNSVLNKTVEKTNGKIPEQKSVQVSDTEKLIPSPPIVETTSPNPVFDLEKKRNPLSTPKLSSLSSLKEKILAKEAGIKTITNIDLADLLEIWENYAKKNDSPSVRNILRSADIDVDRTIIKIRVAKKLHKEIIQQEVELFENLREALEMPNLEFNMVIDKSMVIPDDLEKPKKLWTIKEKYETMVEVNPLVHELRMRLDLKIDSD